MSRTEATRTCSSKQIDQEIQSIGLFDNALQAVSSQYELDLNTRTISRAPILSSIGPRNLNEPTGFTLSGEVVVGQQVRTSFRAGITIIFPDGRGFMTFCVPVDTAGKYGVSDLELKPGRFILDFNGNLCEIIDRERVRDVLGLGLWDDVTYRDAGGKVHSARIGPTPSSFRPISSIVVGFAEQKS